MNIINEKINGNMWFNILNAAIEYIKFTITKYPKITSISAAVRKHIIFDFLFRTNKYIKKNNSIKKSINRPKYFELNTSINKVGEYKKNLFFKGKM